MPLLQQLAKLPEGPVTEIWGTVPQWVSAVVAAGSAAVAAGALIVARNASLAWQKTLIAKRGDDLLAAAHDVTAAIYKLSDAVGRGVSRDSFGRHVDEAYGDFRELRKAYAIAQRSYPKLTEATLNDLSGKVDEMKSTGDLYYAGNRTQLVAFEQAANEAKAKGDKFVETVTQVLAAS